MAKQSKNKFIKRQRELDRVRKAQEKMARRQGKNNEDRDLAATEKPLNTIEEGLGPSEQ